MGDLALGPGTVRETCTSTDCEDESHVFPVEGTRVRLTQEWITREPGTDGTGDDMFTLPAGTEGVVIDYVVEWHDVVVAIMSRDGQPAWCSWDVLEVVAPPREGSP